MALAETFQTVVDSLPDDWTDLELDLRIDDESRYIDASVYLSDRVVVLTHAPTEVKEIVPVELPTPRDQIATKELPEFAHLRAHVYRLIRREQAAAPPDAELVAEHADAS